mmetsp:Transcript_12332/g.37115  ORF Transcript_12332/g.37115 Transcript_12332/m.37115 type:complete len:245 (-) Transcript_12332:1775-2509(-)
MGPIGHNRARRWALCGARCNPRCDTVRGPRDRSLLVQPREHVGVGHERVEHVGHVCGIHAGGASLRRRRRPSVAQQGFLHDAELDGAAGVAAPQGGWLRLRLRVRLLGGQPLLHLRQRHLRRRGELPHLQLQRMLRLRRQINACNADLHAGSRGGNAEVPEVLNAPLLGGTSTRPPRRGRCVLGHQAAHVVLQRGVSFGRGRGNRRCGGDRVLRGGDCNTRPARLASEGQRTCRSYAAQRQRRL